MREFGSAFTGADVVLLTDIYAAGEDPIEGVTLDALADTVRSGFDGELRVVPALADVPGRACGASQRPGDLIVLLGAGSIGSIAGAVLRALEGTELMPCDRPGRQAFPPRAPQAVAETRPGWQSGDVGAPGWASAVPQSRSTPGSRRSPLSRPWRSFTSIRSTCEGITAVQRRSARDSSWPAGPQHPRLWISRTGGARC